jgi:phosphatidylglycerophosphate synthase
LIPDNNDLILTLCLMYQPVFGVWATWLFLFGAIAVLYSTFFVANAGHARVAADGGQVLGIVGPAATSKRLATKVLCGVFPAICLVVYVVFPRPTTLILLSGAMQAIMLPMLAVAALYFRYRRCDRRVMPGKVWTALLWLSAVGMSVAGVAGLCTAFDPEARAIELVRQWFE